MTLLAVVTLPVEPLGRLEFAEAHDPASVRWIAGDGIASEPLRRHLRFDGRRRQAWIARIDRRRAEAKRLVGGNALVVATRKPPLQQLREPRFLDRLECLRAEGLLRRVSGLLATSGSHSRSIANFAGWRVGF
ncbi:hypothetical protein [Mesorhizobium sp. BHbdii]